MYSLDVNFLNDRKDRLQDGGRITSRPTKVAANPAAYVIGAAVAIALPALALGMWGWSLWENQRLEERQAEVDNELLALQAQLGQISSINAQATQIETETRALATVFDYIKPWSAVLQDMRDRVPRGVQVDLIEQDTREAPPPPPVAEGVAPPPPPAARSIVRISGVARSFNDVNDFLLTLQRSPFLEGESVRITNSSLVPDPTQIEFTDQERVNEIEVSLPQVARYTIEGELTNLPASELLQDLERTLSVGLAARIQALRDRGVLQR